MKVVKVILEKGKDGYGVSFEHIANVYGFGETLDAAKKDAKAALDGFVDALKKVGKPLPELLQGEYELAFEFDTSTLLELASGTVTQAALAKAAGINASQLSQYATGRKTPRPAQRQKIVDGLHKIGQELLSVS